MAGDGDRLRRWLEDAAAKAGFAGVHVTDATLPPETGARLNDFVADGRQGDMAWLAETAPRRASPAAMWPEARSAIVLTMNYGPDHDPMDNLAARDRGNVSVYARGRDYHDVVKKQLKALGRWICETFSGDVKVFVDTAPVMEKPVAQEAGLGWQGKHTNLVSRMHGSWLFLGEVFTTLDLREDTPETDHCGRCRACLDACPTNAFPAPYRIDARRCISYLTIEHKGPIDRELRPLIGNRIYGCDDCLAACPWNKFAQSAPVKELRARPDLMAPKLTDLARLDDASFRSFFSRTAIKRIGRGRFIRNVLIGLGNVGGEGALEAVRERLDDESPTVRGAAVWALSQLLPGDAFEAHRRERAGKEGDREVLAEWDAAAAPVPTSASSG